MVRGGLQGWSLAKKNLQGNSHGLKQVLEESIIQDLPQNGKLLLCSIMIKATHPVQGTKAIERETGKLKYAKLLSNKKQWERILKLGSLDDRKITVHIPGMAAKLRGVISNVPLEMSTEEVKKDIQCRKMIEAKRLQTNESGVKSNSLSVLFVFEKLMPTEVKMGWINHKVREYIPQPLRCFKCQIMGHTAQQCKWRQRCTKCGGGMIMANVIRMLS